MIAVTASAKLNLALRVGPPGSDGYHPLESLMVELDAPADTLTLAEAGARSITCPGIAERENLVWRSLDILAEETGDPLDLAVQIDKESPAGAGLGGGSADAAAAMLGARRLRGLSVSDARLEQLAAEVGSDVPFFVRGGAQWARGRGEVLEPTTMPPFHAVVCFRGPPLSTPSVYARFDELPPPGGRPRDEPPPADPDGLGLWAHNDLWQAAVALRPGLRDLADEIERGGGGRPLLCGSGAAVCGLFPDAESARRAAARMSPRADVWLAGPRRR